MNLLTENRLDQILNKQRTFFKSHTTKDVSFRKEKLKKLLSVVESYESEITDALKKRSQQILSGGLSYRNKPG